MIKKFFLVILFAGLAAGCSQDSGSSSESSQAGPGNPLFNKFAKDDADSSAIEKLQDSKTFYFGFDKSSVGDQDKQQITELANYLLTHPDWQVHIDGHTDERGSREYNVGLGERRAKAIAETLFAQGVSKEQVKIISYGKEKPAVQGHDEFSWQKNRRAELSFKELA